ncbi:hypothetical protein O7622_24315 [Micromonospora sp. WMMD1076]|uniref:hypothetical protein n=1 Tax=Micromonospora sp. WMMD1076 TaxID=3016103 RepID=UPI00249BF87B|nr:hypothetical protein [Micromonospora sp. WMMD1076]WFF06156.1 hypothetical protein O7622_24315 [Micromonospora sp. WMMD1076]
MTTPLYDDIADWYEEYAGETSSVYMDRVRSVLADLLGDGPDRCVDLCCGTGAHAGELRRLPLAGLLDAVAAAGLRLTRVVESGSGPIPDVLALEATKPH